MAHIRKYTNLIPQPIRFGLRRMAFRGSNVTCVLCGSSLRGFAPHGGGPEVLDRRKVVGGMRRDADRCPVCHGCDRTRMMALYLEHEIGGGQQHLNILHIAPEYGLYLWLKRQAGVTYTGCDIDTRRYRHIENMRTANLMSMPFDADSFDIVICSHVLEHVPDDLKAMREIRRLLRPGGAAMLLVPLALDGLGTDGDPSIVDPAEQERRFGQWDHVRLYGKDDFLARLTEAGFEVSAFSPFERMPEEAERLHLNPLEILPIGRKPRPS
jgi:SAM-dependent methyltransferase